MNIYQIDPRPTVPILEDPGWFEDEDDTYDWEDMYSDYIDDLGHEIDIDYDEL